jgi:transglutaminase-like putative cysteine protease
MNVTRRCAILTLIALAASRTDVYGQRLPPEVTVSNPTVYDVTITTKFTVPANGKELTRLAVWHALPNARPWDGLDRTLGASAITFEPNTGRLEHLDKGSQHLVWEYREKLAAGRKFEFVSRFRVRSADRQFDPTKSIAKWSDYGINYDRPVSMSRQPPIELAVAVGEIKKVHTPAQAALEFCKWINGHIRYDASVPFSPDDLAATLTNGRGHCGHQMALFEAMCTAAKIPTRTVLGLNLNVPSGVGGLHKIRPDFENQHTWAEIYLPGSGSVEIDPGMGENAYYIPAQLIQNNNDFQNYVIWIIEEGVSKMPDWVFRQGRWDSPYGVENLRTFRRVGLADGAGVKLMK